MVAGVRTRLVRVRARVRVRIRVAVMVRVMVRAERTWKRPQRKKGLG